MTNRNQRANPVDRPIGIDLFAGAGGLSLGFEQAGFDVVAAVEFDPIHCATHEFNFPQCKTICKDISKVSGQEIRKKSGIANKDIDVIFGGAPCQGFSLIGKRALDDPRNMLARHFVRLVKELKPRFFVFENVKGLTVGKHKQILNEIIEAFNKLGYRIAETSGVHNAVDFGVPQDRKRLFLVGHRKDVDSPGIPDRKIPVTVWEAIGDLPEATDYPELLERDWVKAKYKKSSEYAQMLRCLTQRVHYGYVREFDNSILTSSLRAEHNKTSQRRFLQTEFGKTEPVSRFHKLDPQGVCNTLRAGTASDRGAFTSPRPIHPYAPRCITVREAARLHSYPDWFRFHATKWHGFRQVGNSVPPLLAQAVGDKLIEALGVKPKKPRKILKLNETYLLEFSMSGAAEYYGVPYDTIPRRERRKEAA